jgi:hypothetical protein
MSHTAKIDPQRINRSEDNTKFCRAVNTRWSQARLVCSVVQQELWYSLHVAELCHLGDQLVFP